MDLNKDERSMMRNSDAFAYLFICHCTCRFCNATGPITVSIAPTIIVGIFALPGMIAAAAATKNSKINAAKKKTKSLAVKASPSKNRIEAGHTASASIRKPLKFESTPSPQMIINRSTNHSIDKLLPGDASRHPASTLTHTQTIARSEIVPSSPTTIRSVIKKLS